MQALPYFKVTETYDELPVHARLEDGTILFSKQWKKVTSDFRQTPIGPWNFGEIEFGPIEEWIRHPDGTEERGSHYAAAMRTVRPTLKPQRTKPQNKPTSRGVWTRIKEIFA